MLNTIWLIMCSMCFGGSMVASRMLESLTNVVLRLVKSRVSLVSSTVGTGIFLNLATGDQSISIILTADMYREVYEKEGYEGRLLSRTTEDAGTVTSVLIPWNTCGMTQSTVLGVPTLTYLPYCFFNLISPFMSILVAATGWKIRRVKVKRVANIVYYIKIFLLISHFYFVFLMLHNILDTKIYGHLFLVFYFIYIIKCIIELLSGKKRFKNDVVYNLMQIGVLGYIIFMSIKTFINGMYVTQITYSYFMINYIILSILILFILIYSLVELHDKKKKI